MYAVEVSPDLISKVTDAVLGEAAERSVAMFMPEVVADGDEFVLSTPPHYEALMADLRAAIVDSRLKSFADAFRSRYRSGKGE